MKITIENFKGEYPRVGEQLLPDNAATFTNGPRMLSGNLTPWKGTTLVEDLETTDAPNSIYLMDSQYWLQWQDSELGAGQVSVDVARGPIAQDTTERTIFTGTDVPRVTNIAKATTGVGKYPIDSNKLGVPEPDTAPELAINQGTVNEDEVELDNADAEDGNTGGWTSVLGDFTVYDNNDVAGLLPFEGNFFFGGGTSAVTEVYQVLPDTFPGQTLSLSWQQASGANASRLQVSLVFFNSSNVEIDREDSPDTAVTPANTWEERSIGVVVPDNAASTRIYLKFTKVGGGANDAYVDDITLVGTDAAYTNDGSSFDGLTYVREDGNSDATPNITFGTFNPAPSIRMRSRRNSGVSLYRDVNFNLNPTNTIEFDFVRDTVSVPFFRVVLGATAGGAGTAIEFTDGSVNIVTESSWTSDRAFVSTLDTSYPGLTDDGDQIRVKLTATRGVLNSYAVNIQVFQLPSLTEVVNTTTNISAAGEYVGFKLQHGGDISTNIYLDNILIAAASQGVTVEEENVVTAYVFTYVNEFGEEGPPSPASRVVNFPEDGSITVTTPTTFADPEYAITNKRIYRAVTVNGITSFWFVAEIDLATADYDDDTAIEDLGEELETVDWDLPPSDGAGVLSLPNGVTCMFSKNQLCPSVINRAHAYPVAYRLNFDSDIVAIGSIDTTVVVGTNTYPYIVLGSDPADMSSAKLEQRQACVSKRSMVSIRSVGVVYASPDGLVAITGAGGLRVLTEQWFSRKEWQELNPSSIVGVVHDDMYFGFYNNGSFGAFIFDPKEGGNGLTFLDYENTYDVGVYISAAFSDPKTDTLYLARVFGAEVTFTGDIISWDTNDAGKWEYTWRSKRFRLPRPASFTCAQIKGVFGDFTSFRIFSGETVVLLKDITDSNEFVLPDAVYTEMRVEILDCRDEIYQIQIAENMDELE